MDAEPAIAVDIDKVYKDFNLTAQQSKSIKTSFTQMFKPGQKKEDETLHALRDISFDIKQGEFFGIVGRNGSGKSTLLKIIAGIYQPNKGSVKVKGKLVPFIELGVGFNPELTGRENIYLNGALLGFSRKQIDAQYDDIVRFAELQRFMDQKLKNYSSGMQVRLAFSLATRAESYFLLVDEVLAVGDADFQRKCFNHFRKLKKEHKTVIFVSHDMSAIREYCDRVVMIEKSKIVHAGSPDDVAKEYVKLFNAPAEPGHSDRTAGNEDRRWGDEIVKLTSVDTQISPEFITITVKAAASGVSEEPVFGYLVKDAAGNDLLGNNTHVQQVKVGDVAKGDKLQVQWKIPNIFDDGIFFITVAATHNDGVSQHDWWDDATSFKIYREDKTPYPINPKAEVKVERL